ncbi:MAG: glycosyltransferase family 4 protein [Anaerolineales bacterium]|nr:glycosyltransferase family 4 protein [Anaerolineales bacterium]
MRLCLQVIGDGSERQQLADMVTRLDLESMVQFAGFMRASAFAPLLAKSEIGFSPYCGRAEFSGLKLLDYKAAGLAVIASGAGGEPAVLDHGKTGWIVPPCDADSLAQAIITLAGDAVLRRKIGQAARLDAEAMHSWKHTAATLLALFGTLPQVNS